MAVHTISHFECEKKRLRGRVERRHKNRLDRPYSAIPPTGPHWSPPSQWIDFDLVPPEDQIRRQKRAEWLLALQLIIENKHKTLVLRHPFIFNEISVRSSADILTNKQLK